MPREQLEPFVVFCFLNDGKLLRPKRIELDKASLYFVRRHNGEWAVMNVFACAQAWSWTECLEELCLSLGAAEELGSLEIMKAISLANASKLSVLNRCAHKRPDRCTHAMASSLTRFKNS